MVWSQSEIHRLIWGAVFFWFGIRGEGVVHGKDLSVPMAIVGALFLGSLGRCLCYLGLALGRLEIPVQLVPFGSKTVERCLRVLRRVPGFFELLLMLPSKVLELISLCLGALGSGFCRFGSTSELLQDALCTFHLGLDLRCLELCLAIPLLESTPLAPEIVERPVSLL